MSSPGSRSPGERAGLTHEKIRREARRILTHHGADGLTMRALADALGVTPNAIYSHVTDKTEIIDTALDDVLGEVWSTGNVSNPRKGLLRMMESTYETLLSHHRLVPLYVDRQGARGANAQRLGQVMLDLLSRLGLTPAAAAQARHVLIVYTIGAASYATAPPLGSAGDPSADETHSAFAAGLGWLLDGIIGRADEMWR